MPLVDFQRTEIVLDNFVQFYQHTLWREFAELLTPLFRESCFCIIFLPEKVKHPQKLIVTSNCTLLDKTVSHALSWCKVNWKGGGVSN